jgi:hypothetical protein
MNVAKSKLWSPLSAAVLSLVYTLPFLLKLKFWGVRDWDLFTTLAAVPAQTILEYGQFPFWNPYHAGGNILFHHPEVAVLSPFLLLYVLFGAVIGLKLQVLLCYFLGFWGSQNLFQKLGMSVPAGLLAAAAYFGSVHFALHFAEGHMPFTHYCFLPWVLYFILRSTERSHAIIGAVLSLSLMILGNGAAIPFLYTLTFCSVFFVLRAWQHRQGSELRNFIVATVGAVALSFVKFLPMTVYMLNNSWSGNPEEYIPIKALGPIFFGLKHSLFARNFPQQYWNWHEYGAYLSPLLVVLAVLALWRHFRAHWPWLITTLFFLLLGLGDFGSLSPWRLMTELPGFSSARATGRAFQFVIFSVAVLGGFGFDWIRLMVNQKKYHVLLRSLVVLIAAIIVGTNLGLAWRVMNSTFVQPPTDIVRQSDFRHVVDRRKKMYENFLSNRGSLISPELSAAYPSRGLVGPHDTVLMEFVLSGQASVSNQMYTPNRISLIVNATRTGKLALSMGYDPGWKSTDGRLITSEQGVISFPFAAGRQDVILTYRSPYFRLGLFISNMSLVAMIFWWRRANSMGI